MSGLEERTAAELVRMGLPGYDDLSFLQRCAVDDIVRFNQTLLGLYRELRGLDELVVVEAVYRALTAEAAASVERARRDKSPTP